MQLGAIRLYSSRRSGRGTGGTPQAPFTSFPSAAQGGPDGLENSLHRLGSAIATELRAVGITMDMAPVLDVLSNPANTVIGDRAFSTDPHEVARLGTAFMRGMHAAGVLAVGKHFPGHGDTLLDSHVALPVCDRTVAPAQRLRAPAFQAAIAAGLEAIMTAHVVYKAWDAHLPATLSSAILTASYVARWDFKGSSSAMTWAWRRSRRPCRGRRSRCRLRAGVDLLLICHQRERQEQAHDHVLSAVQRGDLPETLVDRAVARIHTLKSRPITAKASLTPAPLACIGSPEHLGLAASIEAQALPRQ